jgi:hypothetical protein
MALRDADGAAGRMTKRMRGDFDPEPGRGSYRRALMRLISLSMSEDSVGRGERTFSNWLLTM